MEFNRRRTWNLVVVTLASGTHGCLPHASILPFAAGYLMFLQCIWIPAVPAAIAYISAFGIAIAYVSHREHAERTLIMQLFGQYVSCEVAKVLWEQRDQFMEGGRPRSQELVATIMITDLQGYTLPAETMDPASVGVD